MEKNKIEIREADILEVLKVHRNIKEFDDNLKIGREYFEERYEQKEKLMIVAYYNDNPIGYIIAYDKFEDKESIYCWMAGVDNHYRRMGTLTQLMNYQIKWAKSKGYKKLKIKTRNNRRDILSFLVKNNFYFTSVEEREKIEENRINLEKNIE